MRPHLAFPTVEIRICDAQPDLGEARSLAALSYALAVRIARALDEGEPLPNHPHRLIEENLWRAIRYGLSGEFIDLETGDVRPARAHLERLLEWVAPVAEKGPLSVTQSIGIAAFPDDGRDRAMLIERADLALYHAKHTGRNRVITWAEAQAAKSKKAS